ncbi:MAG: flavodoxin family protein [Clostridiales Family XIII bacterium]|jgi:multimeric flavodoxin WrbA|nr:flavodoxin family protein [Clostridiales Family XIII bacterium]
MKVLLVNGSPHEKGTTYAALRTVADAIEAEGAEAEIYHIGAEPIRGCVGCGQCKRDKNNRCKFDGDAVNAILEKSETADGFIFGTPTYYASANGALVSVMDRIAYAGNAFSGKPAGSVAVARRGGTTGALDVINKYFPINNMPMVATHYWPIAYGATFDDIREDIEGLQTMTLLGKNIVWMIRCFEAGKAAGIELPTLGEKRAWTNFVR